MYYSFCSLLEEEKYSSLTTYLENLSKITAVCVFLLVLGVQIIRNERKYLFISIRELFHNLTYRSYSNIILEIRISLTFYVMLFSECTYSENSKYSVVAYTIRVNRFQNIVCYLNFGE